MMAGVTEGYWMTIFMSVVQAGPGTGDLVLLLRDQRMCQVPNWSSCRPCCRQTSTARAGGTKRTVINYLHQLLIQKAFTIWGFCLVFLGTGRG